MSTDEYKRIFSYNLRRLMSKNGKTQIDLINDLDLNKSAVSTWVNGTRLPRMDKVQQLADYFGCLRSDLIEEKPTEDELILSVNEMKLIDMYRCLDEIDKAKLFERAEALKDQEKYKKDTTKTAM